MQGTGSALIFLKFRATSVGAITFIKKRKRKMKMLTTADENIDAGQNMLS
jgi:hypothetical protein